MKYFFDSEPLSTRTRLDLGCLHNQVLLNNCDTRADDLSFSGTSTISNQPVTRSMKVMATNVSSIGISFLYIRVVSIVYGPIRSTLTSAHGSVSTYLTGNLLYLRILVFLSL